MNKRKSVKRVVKKENKFPRELIPTEYEVRDITWAVGLKCVCGRELDLFNWNEPIERVCKDCGRKYDIILKAYEVQNPKLLDAQPVPQE